MLYPVYIHMGDEQHAHGATLPDFPGCFSSADDWQDLPRMVQEAVELWCEGQELDLPQPTPLTELVGNAEYEQGIWALMDINTAHLDTKTVRLNISLPQGLVKEIDRYAKEQGATRSGFLAKAARQAMHL